MPLPVELASEHVNQQSLHSSQKRHEPISASCLALVLELGHANLFHSLLVRLLLRIWERHESNIARVCNVQIKPALSLGCLRIRLGFG